MLCAGPALLYVGVPSSIAPTVRLKTQRQRFNKLNNVQRPGNLRNNQPTIFGNPVGPPETRGVRVIPNPQPQPPNPSPNPLAATQFRPGVGVNRQPSLQGDPEFGRAVTLVMRQVTPVLLGVCEDTPDIRFSPAYVPYHTDYSGPVHPHDRFFAGAEASVTAELTEFNAPLYGILQSYAGAARFALQGGRPRPQPFPLRGLERSGHVGTMVGRESSGVPLWIVLPYASKPAFAAAGMEACYRFFCATLDDDSPGPLSCRPRKIRLRWTCQRLPVANSTGYLLMDTSPVGLPPVEL